MNRKRVVLDADGNVESTRYYEMTWDQIRKARNRELQKTDWWALKDLTLSTARKAYRKFLRDLPSNYSTANEAADAWAAYEIPE